MSVFTSLIVALVAMLIQVFLDLGPGIFAIFYHHAQGKTSIKKADDRALSFILGVEIGSALVFLIVYIVVNFFITEFDIVNQIFLWIMSGIFFIESFFVLFFYFRKEKTKKFQKSSTALFLPRRVSNHLIYRAEHARDRSSTITLGLVTHALELPLTLPLYIIMSVCIFYSFQTFSAVFITVYVILATIPLFIIRALFHTDHNLAEIQRLRFKKKLPTRIILFASYLTIAITTLIIGFSL